jgi:hypothetical protein
MLFISGHFRVDLSLAGITSLRAFDLREWKGMLLDKGDFPARIWLGFCHFSVRT